MEKLLDLEEIYQLGLLYSNMGDYEKAKSYYLESKTIKEYPDYSQALNFGTRTQIAHATASFTKNR